MFKKKGELAIPSAAKRDREAVEIASIWAADGNLHVMLHAELWEDPASWGLMLVDLARHVANAYEQLEKFDRAQALKRIKEGFEAEWNSPTNEAEGQIID